MERVESENHLVIIVDLNAHQQFLKMNNSSFLPPFRLLSHMKCKKYVVCSNVTERKTRTYFDEMKQHSKEKDVSSALQFRKWLASS